MLDALDRFLAEAQATEREAAIEPVVKRVVKKVAAAFDAEGEHFLTLWNPPGGGSAIPGPDEFGDDAWGPWLEAAFGLAAPLFLAAIQDAVGAGLEAGAKAQSDTLGIGVSFDLKNPRAVAYLEQHGAALVTKIDDTTREYIKTVVTNGVRDGQSYDEIAKSISDRYEEFKVGKPQEHIDSRAHLVAVTEMGEAYEAGNQIVAQDLMDAGLDMEKFWQTSEDERVSDGCQENQDAGWIPIADPFPSGHMHPLRFPGCRCMALYRRKGAGGKK
jgi:hypothetical protein